MLRLGLQLVGFNDSRQRVRNSLSVDRFRAHYGIGPRASASLLADLRRTHPEATGLGLFKCLSFLKLYDTEHVLSGRWGLCEETIRNHIKTYLDWMEELSNVKIVWGDFDDDEIFIVSVDGVHCKIFEPRTDPGSKWFDHKVSISAAHL